MCGIAGKASAALLLLQSSLPRLSSAQACDQATTEVLEVFADPPPPNATIELSDDCTYVSLRRISQLFTAYNHSALMELRGASCCARAVLPRVVATAPELFKHAAPMHSIATSIR